MEECGYGPLADDSTESHTIRYRVTFRMDDRKGITSGYSLSDIKDGFWVDDGFNLTKKSDARYFIMPHMITQILKVVPQDGQEEN